MCNKLTVDVKDGKIHVVWSGDSESLCENDLVVAHKDGVFQLTWQGRPAGPIRRLCFRWRRWRAARRRIRERRREARAKRKNARVWKRKLRAALREAKWRGQTTAVEPEGYPDAE